MELICPYCGDNLKADVDVSGGCAGHSGPDDYCYCDSPDVSITILHTGTGVSTKTKTVGKGVLAQKVAICAFRDEMLEAKTRWGSKEPKNIITDKYALARFLTDNETLQNRLFDLFREWNAKKANKS